MTREKIQKEVISTIKSVGGIIKCKRDYTIDSFGEFALSVTGSQIHRISMIVEYKGKRLCIAIKPTAGIKLKINDGESLIICYNINDFYRQFIGFMVGQERV